MLRSTLVAAALIVSAAPAFASADLPDATYHCATSDGVSLGDIRVEGENYAGSNPDGTFGTPEMFIVMDGGKVEWLGSLPAFEAAGYRIDSSSIVTAGGLTRIDLVVLADGASDFGTASCIP